jgi:plastocyanin
VRRRPLPIAVAVLGLALSPATLWAQDPVESEQPLAPQETAAPNPDAPPPEPAEQPSTAPPAEPTPAPETPAPSGEPAQVVDPAPAAIPVARQGSASVSIIDFAFSPSSVQVNVGGTVTWANNGDEPHDATANGGSFATGELAPGASGSATFSQAGTFSYFCSIHPDMTGSVTVLAAEDPGTGTGDDGDTDDGSTVPGPTEADAVASPDAAGTEGGLPATGEEVGLLAALGLALLAFGLQLLVAQRVRA